MSTELCVSQIPFTVWNLLAECESEQDFLSSDYVEAKTNEWSQALRQLVSQSTHSSAARSPTGHAVSQENTSTLTHRHWLKSEEKKQTNESRKVPQSQEKQTPKNSPTSFKFEVIYAKTINWKMYLVLIITDERFKRICTIFFKYSKLCWPCKLNECSFKNIKFFMYCFTICSYPSICSNPLKTFNPPSPVCLLKHRRLGNCKLLPQMQTGQCILTLFPPGGVLDKAEGWTDRWQCSSSRS